MHSDVLKSIQSVLDEQVDRGKIGFIPLTEDTRPLWANILEKCSFVSIYYELFWIDYQVPYQEGRYDEFIPACQIITYANQPFAVWPIALCCKDNTWYCEGMWGYIREPAYIDSVTAKIMRRITKRIYHALKAIKKRFEIETLEIITQNWLDNEPGPLHRVCAEAGHKTHVSYASVIDFDQKWENIWSSIRKSYKNLINLAMKNLQVENICQDNLKESVFREFQYLHFREAGRKTRLQETWDIQWKAIEQGNCFLITLRYQNELIGGGLFSHNSHFAEYWVAAYRKDIPGIQYVGHGVLGAAIRYLHEMKIKLLCVGERHCPGDVWWPFGHPHDEKWMGISDFKAGFANRYAFVFFHYL